MQMDDRTLRKYLLGAVSEAEENEIGLRLMTDEDLSTFLEHIENELLEDFITGNLSSDEQRLFRQNYLISDRRRSLLNEVKLLRAEALGGEKKPAKMAAASKPSAGFLSFFRTPAFAGFAALVLVAACAFVWLAYFRDSRTGLEVEYAALNRRELNDVSRTQPLFALNLTPGNLRSSAGAAVYPASKMTDPVLFRLALPVPDTEGAEIPVSIEKAGKKVFHVDTARVFRNPFGMELKFMVPKEVLPPGQYQVAIEVAGKPFSGDYYQFRVE